MFARETKEENKTQTIAPEEYEIFIGIDVAKTSFAFTVQDNLGMSVSKKIPARPEQLSSYVRKYFVGKKAAYAYDAGL